MSIMKDSIAVYKIALTKLNNPILDKKFSNTDQRRGAYRDELQKIASSLRQNKDARIARKALKDVSYLKLESDGSE